MTEHVWERTGDGTAHYCAQCRMRVDDDEFDNTVEDSLCVPYVPALPEYVKPLADPPATMGDANEPMITGYDLAHPGTDMTCITFTEATPSLVEFAKLCGLEVSPWQLQVLKTIDADIRRKKVARGIPH